MATFMATICIEETDNLRKFKEEKILSYINQTLAYYKDQMH